jgi:hypothetical protein
MQLFLPSASKATRLLTRPKGMQVLGSLAQVVTPSARVVVLAQEATRRENKAAGELLLRRRLRRRYLVYRAVRGVTFDFCSDYRSRSSHLRVLAW